MGMVRARRTLLVRRIIASIAAALLVAPVVALAPGPAAAAEVCTGAECDSVAFVDDSARFHVYEDLLDSSDVGAFYFGDPGDVPLAGDWNCDGDRTPAAFRPSEGFVYLRNQLSHGPAEMSFFLGDPGDIPLVGDFDGDGCDTVGVYRPSNGKVYLRNKLGPGAAEVSYYFGNPGDVPFVGDFDGDGVDTIGLHRRSTGLVYFRNTHTQGTADWEFIFGDPGDVIMAGDWNGDGIDTVAAYRPRDGVLYVTNRNDSGIADHDLLVGRYRHAVHVGEIDQLDDEILVEIDPARGPVGIAGDWDLIFEDPFDEFDGSVWRTRFQWTPFVINNELQAYVPDAVSVAEGTLRLTASDTPADGQPYTSGVITSYGKFSFLYGAVEFRAKPPAGQGLLSALWMLPDNHDHPPEIDLIEINGAQPHLGHFGYHWPSGDGIGSDLPTTVLGDQSDDFHTYAVTWDPGLIVWYVDGVEMHRFAGPRVASQEMYLLANLAVGGWVGAPDGSTPLPATLEIDYVRVWQRS
jgi:hypothetical protein